MKHITIDISEDAQVTVEAHGFKGKGCEAATKAIEEALGAVAARKKKPEYHQTETVTPKQTIGRG